MCRRRHVGKFVFFYIAEAYNILYRRTSITPSSRFWEIPAIFLLCLAFFLHSFRPHFRTSSSFLSLFQQPLLCKFIRKPLDNPGDSVKEFVDAHRKTSCLSVLYPIPTGETEKVLEAICVRHVFSGLALAERYLTEVPVNCRNSGIISSCT